MLYFLLLKKTNGLKYDSFFRIFGLGYYLYYRIYSNYGSIILTNCIVLYMMGVYWSIQLCKSAPFLKLNKRLPLFLVSSLKKFIEEDDNTFGETLFKILSCNLLLIFNFILIINILYLNYF